jgi:hypothetical protein
MVLSAAAKATKAKLAAATKAKAKAKAKTAALARARAKKANVASPVKKKTAPVKRAPPAKKSKPAAAKGTNAKNMYVLVDFHGEMAQLIGVFDTLAKAKKVVADISEAGGNARNAYPAYVLKAKERPSDSQETLIIIPTKTNALRFPYDQEHDDSGI